MRLSPAPETTSLCLALLLLIIPLASSTAGATNTTAPPCAPAWCGDLTIASPFWLAGTHPPECGRQGFQVTCDNATAYLRNSLWTYRIQAIFYGFKNLRVTNVDLLNGTCNLQKFANASTVVKPFYISPQQNQELFFIYGCNLRAQQLPPSWAPVSCANGSFANVSIPNASFAWLSGEYRPNDDSMTLPGNCSVSMIPVMAYKGATGADYQRLMEGGFMIEYLTEDCEDCHCSDGVTWLVPWVSLLIQFSDAIDWLEQASDPATQDCISLPAALTIGGRPPRPAGQRGGGGCSAIPANATGLSSAVGYGGYWWWSRRCPPPPRLTAARRRDGHCDSAAVEGRPQRRPPAPAEGGMDEALGCSD